MASTFFLKLTYLIQLISTLLFPFIGFVLALFTTVLLEVFSFGTADPGDFTSITNFYIYVGIVAGVLYFLDTIGLISKSNFSRILGVVLNALAAIFFFGLGISSILDNSDINTTIIVMAIGVIYLLPVYTLSLHKNTTKLF